MRGFRSTLILLVVLTGLLGYIYYGMKPGSQPVAEQKPRVFTLETDKIEELQVKASGGEVSALRKVDGAWQVVAPVQAKADEAEVSGILTNLASLENQRVVDENPADLAQFGLAPARVEVGFRKAGEKDVTRIQFGDKTATGGDLYAKRPAEKRVFLVSSFIETTFDRTSFDLRDKTILTFARDQADQIEVLSADQSLSLKKSGDRWSIATPIAARADSTVVDGLIGRLQTSQMKSIAAVAPAPEELKTFGLDKPAITATVGAGSSRATLTVGKEAPDGATLYARDASRPMVFTIEKSLADDLRKKAADYRPKDVFEFRPFMATKIDITRDGSTFVFAKSTDKDGKEKWTRANPVKDLDGPKVDALLAALSGLQVSSYVDAGAKTGTGTPALTIAVTFDDGKKEERVVFGRVGADVFATRAGEPGAARVEAAKFDEALAAIDALK